MDSGLPAARLAARREEAEKKIKELRDRLIDTSNRNSLSNFRFSDRSRTHVRVIDELPDVIYGQLVDGKRLTFVALLEPPDEPLDEKSNEFLAALQAARLSDEVYLDALKEF